MQYDVVALSLPLALILWRFLQRRMPVPHGIAAMLVTMGVVSLFGFEDLDCWKLTEGWLLIVLFAAGAWDLFSDSRSQPEASKEEINREAAYVS
jgi:purine-cytosine permease-like protein